MRIALHEKGGCPIRARKLSSGDWFQPEGARSVGGLVLVPIVLDSSQECHSTPLPPCLRLGVAFKLSCPTRKVAATLPRPLPSSGIKPLTLRRPRNLWEVTLQPLLCPSTEVRRVGASLQRRCPRPKPPIQRQQCFRAPQSSLLLCQRGRVGGAAALLVLTSCCCDWRCQAASWRSRSRKFVQRPVRQNPIRSC